MLGVVLWQECAYDFFYMEQLRTFFWSEAFAREVLPRPGGCLEYLTAFLVQFYGYEGVGPMVTAGLFLALALGCDALLRHERSGWWAPLGSLLPAGMFIVLETDMNYRTEGTLAAILCLALLNGYVRTERRWLRWIGAVLVMPLFAWACGPAVLALAIGIGLLEAGRRNYGALALILWAVAPLWLWWQGGEGGEARTFFLPDAYYDPHLMPQKKVYYPWMALAGVVAAAAVCRWTKLECPFGRRGLRWVQALQVVGALAYVAYLFTLAHGAYQYQMKRLDVYRVRGEWDRILRETLRLGQEELHACYRNLALAQKGVLADSLFHYEQCPPKGLTPEWDGTRRTSDLLNDIYWAQGNVAQAQKMAFDAMYFNERFAHPRLLLRLAETNYILGEPKVAEKYLRLCKQSPLYADRAEEISRRTEEQWEEARRCLPRQKDAILSNFYKDTQWVLSACPSKEMAIHYLGCQLLLDNDLEGFADFVEYGFDRDALRPMPVHFQEAMLMVFDEEKCRNYGVTEEVAARYADFKRRTSGGKTRENAAAILRAGYGKTFWVHSMIYNQKTR